MKDKRLRGLFQPCPEGLLFCQGMALTEHICPSSIPNSNSTLHFGVFTFPMILFALPHPLHVDTCRKKMTEGA